MKPTFRYPALAGLLCAMAMGSAQAQTTITSGGASFVRPATSAFDASPTANFTGAGTGDYVFETGWWFRVSGATQETFFPVPTNITAAGNSSTITWADPSGTGAFSASEVATITSTVAGSGTVRMDMTITNSSAANPLTVDLFHFIDLDVNGTAGTDSVAQPTAGVPLLRVTDTTAGFAEYTGHGANAFLVRPFAATTDVAGLLGDTLVTNFDNSGVPATSIDMTGGMQWSLVIPASGSRTITVYFTGNEAAPIPGGGNLAPVFSYTPAAGGTVNFTGGGAVGSTANASIAVAIGTAGSGSGATATTTTTCTVPGGFSGFGQSVTAVGAAAATSGGPLTGSCTLGAAAVNATMTCNENQGGTNVSRTFNLVCPAGAAGTVAPTFTYAPPAGGPVNFTGGTTVGSPATASIPASIGTAGSGSGTAATTTTTCVAPSGFTGFTQSVTAVGNAATTSGGPLTGSCTLGAAVANATMTCTENQGGTNVSRTFNLVCPAGVAGNVAPTFTYAPPAGGPVNFTGGTTVGSTGTASIAASIGTAGSGSGTAATTTTTCVAPSGFTGFTQSVTAVGNAATTSGGPLTGSCTLGAAAANATMTCTENQGGTNVSRTFNLVCPAGTASGVVGVLSASVAFGPQALNSTFQRVLTITNTGAGALTVNTISAVTAPFAQVAGGTCGATPFALAGGAQCTVFYTFTPTTQGDFSQVVTITSTGGTVTATLSGRGVAVIQLPLGGPASLLLLGLLGLAAMLVLRRR